MYKENIVLLNMHMQHIQIFK